MKTLKTVQTLAKIGKIFSKIIFICSIVGVVRCALGLACVPLGSIILSQTVVSVLAGFVGGKALNLEDGDSVMLGVAFIITSLLCRLGAEQTENQ